MNFVEKWYRCVDKRDSVLCAGFDPAEFGMGRGRQGLLEDEPKSVWSINFLNAVSGYVSAVKPNLQFWQSPGDIDNLKIIAYNARDRGLVSIKDAKLADIGSTNEAGVFYAAKQGFDAVTVAPFAGNLEEIVSQGRKWDVGIITMCLMSNPEYEAEKSKLVRIDRGNSSYRSEDVVEGFDGKFYVPQFIKIASDAARFGVDGIVIGAPSPKNHIKESEIEAVSKYFNGLVLLPGVGAQGGEARSVWKYFGKDSVIVNVGRELMFPEGLSQRVSARLYNSMLNNARGD